MAEQDKVIEALNARIEALEKKLSEAQHVPSNRLSAAYSTRMARREARAENVAEDLGRGTKVRCRIERFVPGKGDARVSTAQNIVLSPTWRTRGIWPDAPNELRVKEDDTIETKPDGTRVIVKGKPIIHELPPRVFKALESELVKV